MGKDYYGYHGVSKATTASGGNGKRTGDGSGKDGGGGSGKPLGGGRTGGRDYYGYLGVNKASTVGTIRKQPEKNPRGNKEAERRSEQSSRSYKVLHDPPRRPAYGKHPCAEEKPKGKLPLPALSDADWGGVGYIIWK